MDSFRNLKKEGRREEDHRVKRASVCKIRETQTKSRM